MIYFDNSATTKPYPEVMASFSKVACDYYGNPSSLHGMGAKAEKLLTQARKQVAELLEVKYTDITFTSGGTESNNLAIKGAAYAYANRGKHIITTEIEHASVKEACKFLESVGFEVTYLPVNKEGKLSFDDFNQALRDDTILVSIMHVNNEVGSIQPIKEIGQVLKKRPQTIFHVDNVQGIGKVPLSLTACGVDLCSLSGHKFHALKGTGVLYVREGITLSPLFSGGNQEANRRSGTENVAGAVALAKALRMTFENQIRYQNKLNGMKKMLVDGLTKIDGILVNSTMDGAPHIINFSIPGIKTEVFIHALEEKEIIVSTTSACSSKKRSLSEPVLAMFHDEKRAESVVRISLSYENEPAEASIVLDAVKEIVMKLEKLMR